MSCVVCSDEHPCLFDVIADPQETKNLAGANPGLAASTRAVIQNTSGRGQSP